MQGGWEAPYGLDEKGKSYVILSNDRVFMR